jgi:hypothetical protein
MEGHCGCAHEHCHEINKPQKTPTFPLTMENLEKGVKNINIIIDMIDTRQDEKREQMIIFLKAFFDDLVTRYKNKDKPAEPPKEEAKEPELPVMERINKSLLQVLQLKPAVMLKYGSELLDKVWELNDEVNNYMPPDALLSQPFDKRLTPRELMEYFLQLLFGGGKTVSELLSEKFVVIDEDKKKVGIDEEKIKEIVANPDKYINDNNLLSNLMLLKIFSYTKPDIFYTSLSGFLMSLDNRVIKFYKTLSFFAFCLWTLSNKKDDLVRSSLYILGGVLKDFSRSLLKTEKVDINTLTYFKEKQKEEHFFKAVDLPEKSVILLKKFLLVTVVNFIAVFISGYDASKPYDIQDGNYWDEYNGLILRLKDPKLTEMEKKEIPRMIPLSLDMKSVIILFVSDILFFFCTHFTYVKDNKLVTDFEHFDCLKEFAKYMIINSNYNILVFFQKNILHQRFSQVATEKMEYEMKDNFNTYGIFFVFFLLLQEKKVPLIINKKAYVYTMTEYLKVILKEGKEFGLPQKREEIMKYYINEMKKCKMLDLEDDELKEVLI